MKRDLYKLIFPNGKFYIGIAKNYNHRFRQHKNAANRGVALPVYNAIRKFGDDQVQLEVLAAGTKDYIANLEIKAIEAYKSRHIEFCYNVAICGELGCMSNRNHTDESKAKMSAGQKSRIRTEEEMARMSTLHLKHDKTNAEYRQKCSESALKRFENPEQRKQHSELMKKRGIKPSAIAIENSTKTMKSEEFRKAQSERMKEYYRLNPHKVKGFSKSVQQM